MSKENITKRIISISESYLSLQVEGFLPGTESHRAINDAVKIGEMEVDNFYSAFGMEYIYLFPGQNFERIRAQNEIVQSAKEQILKQNENKMEYLGVFKKVCDWLEKGYDESGITTGEKCRFLKDLISCEKKEKII